MIRQSLARGLWATFEEEIFHADEFPSTPLPPIQSNCFSDEIAPWTPLDGSKHYVCTAPLSFAASQAIGESFMQRAACIFSKERLSSFFAPTGFVYITKAPSNGKRRETCLSFDEPFAQPEVVFAFKAIFLLSTALKLLFSIFVAFVFACCIPELPSYRQQHFSGCWYAAWMEAWSLRKQNTALSRSCEGISN